MMAYAQFDACSIRSSVLKETHSEALNDGNMIITILLHFICEFLWLSLSHRFNRDDAFVGRMAVYLPSLPGSFLI
jgi:hypothetical protein